MSENKDEKQPDIKSDGKEQFYSKTLKQHFFNPKNFVDEQEPQFDWNAKGEVGSPACGDVMRFWLKINPKTEKIQQSGWKTFGCASAIASSSVLSEMIKGKTVKKALEVTPADIKKELGGLPNVKVHCSVLGDKALESAINDYFHKTNQFDRITNKKKNILDQETMTSQKDIEKALKEEGVTTFEELQKRTKVGTGDPKVEKKAKEVFEHYRDKQRNAK